MKELNPYLVKYKKFMIPAALLFLSLIMLFGVIIPQISSISETNKTKSEALNKITKLEQSLSVIQKTNSDVVDSDLKTVTTALPTSKDISLIFSALNNVADKSGVSLDEFSLKVGGIYGRAEEVDTGGVTGVPTVDVKVQTSGSAINTVIFAKNMKEQLPLSEIKLIDNNQGTATYEISFFYKPLDLNVLKQDEVASITQADKNLVKQLEDWNQ